MGAFCFFDCMTVWEVLFNFTIRPSGFYIMYNPKFDKNEINK